MLQTLSLKPIKDSPHHRFRVEATDDLIDSPFRIIDNRMGKCCSPYSLEAELRILLAIEVIHGEAPLLLMLDLIHHHLQIATVHAVGREVLDELEGARVSDLTRVLRLADEMGVRLEPLLALRQDQHQGHHQHAQLRH